MPNSPLLYGPNNISNNLQNSILNANGQQLAFNGAKNYLTNPTIELGTTSGWGLGTVTLTSNLPTGTPTFGSGASGNLTLSATSTTPLSGIYSLSYASAAATTAGNFVASDAFTVDTADLGKILSFSFYYKATSNPSNGNWAGTTANSFAVAIYDVTLGAANWIIPIGVFNITQSSGTGICTGSFQSSVTSGQQYRIVIYNANATAGAITMYFDQLTVGPSPQAQVGGVVSFSGTNASQAVTANVTNFALTTVKDSNAAWNGTQYVVPIAGDYFIGGGCILSAATAIMAYVNGTFVAYGSNSFTPGATSNLSAVLTGLKPGDLISIRCSGSVTVTTSQFGIFLVGSQSSIGSGVGAGGVIAASAHVTSAASTTSSNPINFDTVDFDTAGAITTGVGTWKFTCPVTGYYNVSSFLFTAAGSLSFQLNKNGSAFRNLIFNTSSQPSPSTTIISCNAGDTLDIRPTGTCTVQSVTGSTLAQSAWISISLVPGNSISNSANPSINARYFASATSISGSLATVVWTTKDFDSANGMSSGVYTIPVTGKYQVNTGLVVAGTYALNGTADLQIQKNGTVVSEDNAIAGGAQTSMNVNCSDIINCVAGDTVRVQVSTSATGPSISASNTKNFFSIALVGY